MTKEIALHCMKSASELERELCEDCPIYGQTGCDHCYEDALQYVIGMLEQEPTDKNFTKADVDAIAKALNEGWELRVNEVLDKIRAEITEYGSIWVGYAITKDTKTDKGIEKLVSDVLKQAKKQVLEIIDKYKAEIDPQKRSDKE